MIALLYLLPALGLIALLLFRRYPGERRLLSLSRPRRRRRGAPRLLSAQRRPTSRLLPRGGRLIASSLAVRPPPPEPTAI